ncbi:MAG: tryptophan 7-halogenase [Sphingomonadales bacterium]|nr:tryptophan 7-halogenase [Sphingomonadales bacterium]
MARPVQRVVIVGGGTAGWLAACLLAVKAPKVTAKAISITLIEAPDIPTIGVGEGTWPTMRATLLAIGLDEEEFLVACDGSFKQGSRFDRWATGADEDSYYHPFTPPPDGTAVDLVSAWQALAPGAPYAFTVCPQPAICAAQLAPKQRSMAPYSGALNYAYHLDAAKLAQRLSRHAVGTLGVTHLRDQVVAVDSGANGDIAAVRTRGGERVEGDLFIDCSGHAALLIGGHYGVEWIDRSPILANDRAIAVQMPVAEGSPIQSQTIGTAHEAGWIWDIGLPSRRGVGCVYASRFLEDDKAEAILRDYIARTAPDVPADGLTPRRLSFPTGHRAQFWRGNCLAVGLSAGFIEPLEASAIVMIELSLNALIDNFPASRSAMDLHAVRFNELFRARWDRVVEFLKLHYLLSRRDEPYWRAQRDPATVPPRLAELVELWRDQPPSRYDLPLIDEIFPAASYQYVWYGMGGAVPSHLPPPTSAMCAQLDQLRQRTRSLLSALPANRALLGQRIAAGEREKVVQP